MKLRRRYKKDSFSMHARPRSFFWRAFKYLLLVCVFLFLLSALFIYFVFHSFKDKSEEFNLEDVKNLESASILFDRRGKEIGRFYIRNREPIHLKKVPDHLIQALVAQEDSRFHTHGGVDYTGILRAILLNLKAGKVTQGASTITQQLARQSFNLLKRSYKRKILEAFVAVRIENFYTKEEILQHYLNRIYFGESFYGIRSAARGYFQKDVAELSLAESATLVGLIKSPVRLSPIDNPKGSENSRNQVLKRMHKEKMINTSLYRKTTLEPLVINPYKTRQNRSYVSEYIKHELIDELGFEQASSGGFRIFTTIDAELQKTAEKSLLEQLSNIENSLKDYPHPTYKAYKTALKLKLPEIKSGPKYLQGAILALDNQSGGILCMVGGRNYHHSQFNRAISARRRPGTAFTPFVYNAGFQKGMFPGTPVKDTPIDNRKVMIGGLTGILGEWGSESPQNTYLGDITQREALIKSKNAATVRVGLEAGLKNVLDLAKKSGIQAPLREYPATFLGESAVSLAELSLAYSIFPNKGQRPERLHIVDTVKNNQGKILFKRNPANQITVANPISCYQTHTCLKQVLTEGSAAGAFSLLDENFPDIAGKTGTNYHFKDNWFLGYNSKITCGTWIGFDNQKTIYPGAFSRDTALPIWAKVMNASAEIFPPEKITPPENTERVEICTRSGNLATDACVESNPNYPESGSAFIRTTYAEAVSKEHRKKLNQFCQVHGGKNISSQISQQISQKNQQKRLDNAFPIPLKSNTVIGKDPFGAWKPKSKAKKSAAKAAPRARQVLSHQFDNTKYNVKIPKPKPIKIKE